MTSAGKAAAMARQCVCVGTVVAQCGIPAAEGQRGAAVLRAPEGCECGSVGPSVWLGWSECVPRLVRGCGKSVSLMACVWSTHRWRGNDAALLARRLGAAARVDIADLSRAGSAFPGRTTGRCRLAAQGVAPVATGVPAWCGDGLLYTP